MKQSTDKERPLHWQERIIALVMLTTIVWFVLYYAYELFQTLIEHPWYTLGIGIPSCAYLAYEYLKWEAHAHPHFDTKDDAY